VKVTEEPGVASPKRFRHGRIVGLVLAITLAAIVVVDLLFDRKLSWWTIGKAVAASALILLYLYIVRFPRLRGR
jgi:hypothetical protein